MILKYVTKGTWGFIDNVRQVAFEQINVSALASTYDETMRTKSGEDTTEYLNGVQLPRSVAIINKAFLMACDGLPDEGNNRHSENLLNVEMLDYPAVSILLYLEDCKEYDSMQLVTNDKAYLMNDKGQTIERLN